MDTKQRLTKKQRREAHRIGRASEEIMALIANIFRRDSGHSFNQKGLLQDRKEEYWPDDYEVLVRSQEEKTAQATETVQKSGATAMANAMRQYCQVLADPNKSAAEGTDAMLDAIHLLFIIAKLGKRDTEHLNNAIINSCARDATLLSLDDMTYRQWQDRQTYYTPEVRAKILQDLKVRTIA